MRVRFWGVRGSVPWAVPQAAGIGCNTPCLEVREDATSATLILDAGTGLVGLGAAVASHAAAHTILLSHYHWDHVQGLPFFEPCFRPGSRIEVIGPALSTADPDWLRALFAPAHFPVTVEALASPPIGSFVYPGPFQAAGFDIRAMRLNHAGGSFAYRIRGATGDLVYATDHEFGVAAVDDELTRFCSGAAALVIDAHHTADELPAMRGWGHASWSEGVALAAAADVAQLWLFHHKPGRSDREVEAIERAAQSIRPGVRAAREGLEFVL